MQDRGFLSFAKNTGKNTIKNLIGKYCQNLFDGAEKHNADAFKTASKRAIQKTSEAISDLSSNKITDALAKLYGNKITRTV